METAVNMLVNAATATIYVPIASPPTPAPSPSPRPLRLPLDPPSSDSSIIPSSSSSSSSSDTTKAALKTFASLPAQARQSFLLSLLQECNPTELLFISTAIAPFLRRDFIRELPYELAVYILGFITDAHVLAQVARVSRFWNSVLQDDSIWKRMCAKHNFHHDEEISEEARLDDVERPVPIVTPSSYKHLFETRYKTLMNWRSGGRILRIHRAPAPSPEEGVVTSVAMDNDWIVVGLANSRIHIFSTHTGVLCRTLIGHTSGVWTVNLISRGGGKPSNSHPQAPTSSSGHESEHGEENWDTDGGRPVRLPLRRARSLDGDDNTRLPSPMREVVGLDRFPEAGSSNPHIHYEEKQSDPCFASEGWGNENALVMTGGCDKILRIWDVQSGYCIHSLQGHTSTIRCARVLHGRSIAVTGSRDTSLRVWDIQRGRPLRVLLGHDQSVRSLDVFGNKAVSGSYDCTCRVWNVDTGECLQVLRGHFHQIYSVAYDGVHIASGALDTTVRIWDPTTGQCLALLQGHTALVCQVQLVGSILATGGSDGRVITFTLPTSTMPLTYPGFSSTSPISPPSPNGPTMLQSSGSYRACRRIAAHDSSVTALQLDTHFLITGGNDGRVRLFEAESGRFVRDLSQPAEAVWKVAHRGDVCVVACRRSGKTVVEIWSFKHEDFHSSNRMTLKT